MAEYKRTLLQEMRELKKEAQTQEDIDVLIASANKMLEAKGIAPISQNVFSKIRFRQMISEGSEEK